VFRNSLLDQALPGEFLSQFADPVSITAVPVPPAGTWAPLLGERIRGLSRTARGTCAWLGASRDRLFAQKAYVIEDDLDRGRLSDGGAMAAC
jgi:hypothetical protein